MGPWYLKIFYVFQALKGGFCLPWCGVHLVNTSFVRWNFWPGAARATTEQGPDTTTERGGGTNESNNGGQRQHRTTEQTKKAERKKTTAKTKQKTKTQKTAKNKTTPEAPNAPPRSQRDTRQTDTNGHQEQKNTTGNSNHTANGARREQEHTGASETKNATANEDRHTEQAEETECKQRRHNSKRTDQTTTHTHTQETKRRQSTRTNNNTQNRQTQREDEHNRTTRNADTQTDTHTDNNKQHQADANHGFQYGAGGRHHQGSKHTLDQKDRRGMTRVFSPPSARGAWENHMFLQFGLKTAHPQERHIRSDMQKIMGFPAPPPALIRPAARTETMEIASTKTGYSSRFVRVILAQGPC